MISGFRWEIAMSTSCLSSECSELMAHQVGQKERYPQKKKDWCTDDRIQQYHFEIAHRHV